MTATTKTHPFLAFVLIGALLALGSGAHATTELVHEFSLDVSEHGFPFHAEASPDGRHLYVETFPPNASLLTFERVGQTLELRDSLSLAAAGMQGFSDIELSEDGAFLFAGEFSTGTLRIFARDAESGALELEQSFEKILGDQPGSANGVIDGVRVATDEALVWGRPGSPETGGVLATLARDVGGWAVATASGAARGDALVSLAEEQTMFEEPIELGAIASSFGVTGWVVVRGGSVFLTEGGVTCEIMFSGLPGLGFIDPTDVVEISLDINAGGAFETADITLVLADGREIEIVARTRDCSLLAPPRQLPVSDQAIGPVDVFQRRLPGSEGPVTERHTVVLLGNDDDETRQMGSYATSYQMFNDEPFISDRILVYDERLPFDGARRALDITVAPVLVDSPAGDELVLFRSQEDPFALLAYVTSVNPPAIHALRLTTDETAGGGGTRCIPGPNTLCLSGFSVETEWEDFRGDTGSGTAVPGSSDSGMFWFFRPSNWEMLVKVLDGCAQNGHYWVLYAATTNVAFDVTVSHDELGSKSYGNVLGTFAPAEIDTNAFQCTPAQAQAARARLEHDPRAVARELGAFVDEATALGAVPVPAPQPQGTCTNDDDTLCLTPDRFRVEVAWRDFQGNTGVGHVVPLRSSDSGLFWFFNAVNWELLVKVLDGCVVNDHFWLLAAATTNVEYTLTITDTATDDEVVVSNPLGKPSAAIIDTSAFAGCE